MGGYKSDKYNALLDRFRQEESSSRPSRQVVQNHMVAGGQHEALHLSAKRPRLGMGYFKKRSRQQIAYSQSQKLKPTFSSLINGVPVELPLLERLHISYS